MVKATSRTVHHDFARYLDLAHGGQSVVITKRGKPWATLTPAPIDKVGKIKWPNFAARAKALSGGKKISAVKALLQMREEERW